MIQYRISVGFAGPLATQRYSIDSQLLQATIVLARCAPTLVLHTFNVLGPREINSSVHCIEAGARKSTQRSLFLSTETDCRSESTLTWLETVR